MIELCYAVSSKITGEEFLRSYGKFADMDDFYSYMKFRYSYTSRYYSFRLSGREVPRDKVH